jgi:hypothetical protein
MKITKEHLRKIFKKYMIQENLGFVSLNASISADKRNVKLSIVEEEEDVDDSYLYN